MDRYRSTRSAGRERRTRGPLVVGHEDHQRWGVINDEDMRKFLAP